MVIDDISRCDTGLQVCLTLMQPDSYEFGPIDITARWRAVGTRVLRETCKEDDETPYALIEVRAGLVSMNHRYQQTQQFQLSFKVPQ